jgi:hypothetical protein
VQCACTLAASIDYSKSRACCRFVKMIFLGVNMFPSIKWQKGTITRSTKTSHYDRSNHTSSIGT